MYKQLFLKDDVLKRFKAGMQTRALSAKRPTCGKSMKDEIGYYCFDCFEDRKTIICEDCFDNSDHYGHRIFYTTQKQGCCDCGDQETLFSHVKSVSNLLRFVAVNTSYFSAANILFLHSQPFNQLPKIIREGKSVSQSASELLKIIKQLHAN